EAGMKHYALSGDALALSRKVAQIQQTVNDDQARVDSLTKAAKPQADDLDIAKAQLGLDTDELADAQQDLARAGGDDRGRIQQELSAHEAAMKQYDSQAASPS